MYRAFNYLKYDAIAIGNHEFNYGLGFLKTALKGAKMPVLNANVYSVKKNKPYFKPYTILKEQSLIKAVNRINLKLALLPLCLLKS